MAEGGSNVSNEEQDEESLFMICGVCRKASLESKPKLLPCLHSFCLTCLEERYKQQQGDQKQNPATNTGSQGLSRLKCPTCGQEFLVPQKGIIGFLDNQFMLESLSKISRKKETTERVCTSCEDKSPATSYCLDCTDWLCDACVQAHQRVRVTKDHTVQTMEEYRANASSTLEDQRPIFCGTHPHEPLKLFCGNCEKLTCRDCQLLEHKDHKYQFVKESACSYREYLRAQLNRLYEQAQPLTESIKDIEKAARGLQEREEVITAEIHKACETLVKAVKQRESVLITELKALVHFKHKLLAKQNKDLRLMQKILQHNYGFTRHVLKSSSDMTLLYSKKQLSSRIHNLLSLKYKVNPVAHSDLKFTMDAEKMASFIGKIGSVITPGDKATTTGNPSVRLDSGFRPVASTSGIQQVKASTVRDPSNTNRVNPYEALSTLNKRMLSAATSTVVNNITVKMSNGQMNQISSSSSKVGANYPSSDGVYQVNSKVAIGASHSPKLGHVGSTSLMPKEGLAPQSQMKYTSSLTNQSSGDHMNMVDYNKTKPLHHYIGASTPPQSTLSSGTGVDIRSFSPQSQNGFGQGMITNVRSLKNSYIRRSPSIKRSHSSSGMATSPGQIRIKQERRDSIGDYSSCTGSRKQVCFEKYFCHRNCGCSLTFIEVWCIIYCFSAILSLRKCIDNSVLKHL